MTKKKALVISANCIGIFLCMLDTTVMNIALPAIQKGLSVSLTDLSWALNIYTILFATLTIPLSRLAERFGINKVYLLGMIIFLIGSICSGLAQNLYILIFGRAIQSIGAAVVFPLSMTIGISTVAIDKRSFVIAALGVTQGLAAALGPTIGGVITQFLTWRWIFLVNFPIVIIEIGLSLISIDFRETGKRTSIDYLGSILSMAGLFSLTLSLVKGREWGWASVTTISLLTCSGVCFLLFIFIETKITNPMVPMKLFKDRQFIGSSASIVLSNLFLVAITVVLPTFFTRIQNKNELEAALLITPISAMIFICSPIAAILIQKVGPRIVILVGFLSMGIAYIMFSATNMASIQSVILACFLLGFGYGIIAGPITVLAASDFTGNMLTASQSVVGVLRQIGVVLAVAIFVTGLYSNINQARSNSASYATSQIEKLKLPTKQNQNMKKLTLVDINSGNSHVKIPKNHFSKESKEKLIRNNYRKIISKQHALPEFARQATLKQVTTEVSKTIASLNIKINLCIKKIREYSVSQYSKAFTKLYSVSIPFVFLSTLSSLLFLKKSKYLELINKKHDN
ncbi:MAG: MFS transporter [Sporolactobacillus sp.]